MEGGSHAPDTQPDIHPPIRRVYSHGACDTLHFWDKEAQREAEIFPGGQHCALLLPSLPLGHFISYSSGIDTAGGPGLLAWVTVWPMLRPNPH